MVRNKRTLLVAALLVSAGATPSLAAPRSSPAPVKMVSGSSPFVHQSGLSGGFQCVKQDVQAWRDSVPGRTALRIAVGEVKDYTGKFSYEATQGGSTVTQGSTLMVMSAVGKFYPIIQQVERYDTRVSETELTLSKQELLRDNTQLRDALRGQIVGSDYTILGGVTEINYNIRSDVKEAEFAQIGGGKRAYTMDVVVELRLVNTKDLTIVGPPVTVRKQIVGYETRFGVFNFLGDYLVDINLGRKDQEPIQYGVRSALELATLELVTYAVGADWSRCRDYTVAAYNVAPPALKPVVK